VANHFTTDIPQSFLDKTRRPSQSPERLQPVRTDTSHVRSTSPTFYCPSGAFQGWKQARLGKKRGSKSVGDLRKLTGLRNEWVWDIDPSASKMERQPSAQRKIGIEDMPFEILGTPRAPLPLATFQFADRARYHFRLLDARHLSRFLWPSQ
jgi:hypothetical protein